MACNDNTTNRGRGGFLIIVVLYILLEILTVGFGNNNNFYQGY